MLDFIAVTLAQAQAPRFTSATALSTLLTVESLMFTVLNVAITASLPTATGTRGAAAQARGLGRRARDHARRSRRRSGVVGPVKDWPDGPISPLASGAIALAIVAEPLLTWTIVAGMPADS